MPVAHATLLNTRLNVSHKGLDILQKSRGVCKWKEVELEGGRNTPGSVYALMIHELLLPVVKVVMFCIER